MKMPLVTSPGPLSTPYVASKLYHLMNPDRAGIPLSCLEQCIGDFTSVLTRAPRLREQVLDGCVAELYEVFGRFNGKYRPALREYYDDAIQESVVKTLGHLPSYSPTRKDYQTQFLAWVSRIGKSTYIDFMRRLKVRSSTFSLDVEGVESIDIDEHGRMDSVIESIYWVDRLPLYLRMLPPTQQELVILRYVQLLPVRQIAAQTSKTENTVKVNLHKARANLRGFHLALSSRDVAAMDPRAARILIKSAGGADAT